MKTMTKTQWTRHDEIKEQDKQGWTETHDDRSRRVKGDGRGGRGTEEQQRRGKREKTEIKMDTQEEGMGGKMDTKHKQNTW